LAFKTHCQLFGACECGTCEGKVRLSTRFVFANTCGFA
jgi:hypothetical protein